MKGFITNIEKDTEGNEFFRKVIFTAKYSQLVLMSLKPGEEIGKEVHNNLDQFFRFEEGKGKVVIEKTEFPVEDGSAVVIPAGTEHNIINTSLQEPLKLYTIYSPPNHQDGTIHKTKEEAEASDEHFDGKTSF
ncbi:MAG: cupin domain-containing protein [Candidatus Nealsonbacteria bacterium CG02_land_8_20_14_3_00_37_10]|uniref:Cupin domain-containing protein n=1 Tax=Candidatus Nealsonbacteria bacterium CG02_land_8_20_14_3_00_37_10 TaxID=1974699 RepID=A0A2M7D957_9BACT|nr:MAG: cupin domain-containing protein [Candidatus Nealsonbacteria bacterium CG02_land_8_20_14_3_00_37_10]